MAISKVGTVTQFFNLNKLSSAIDPPKALLRLGLMKIVDVMDGLHMP